MKQITATSLGGLPIQLDTTVKEYDQVRDYALRLLSKLTPEITDFYPSDPTVALTEVFCALVDVINYYIDRVQNEGFVLTAQQRYALVQMLRLIGYELSPASPATVDVQVTTTIPVVLPVGWTVSSVATKTVPAQSFELLSATALPVPGTHTVSLVHGTSVSNELIGSGTGLENQRYALAKGPIALRSASDLTVKVGFFPVLITWTEVTSFLNSSPTDTHFRKEVDESGNAEIIFGDGVNGRVPFLGESIYADYRYGGGSVGNSVGRGSLTVHAPLAGVSAVTNALQPSGGTDAETNDHARLYGPLSLRALDRAVTLEDYETLAMQVAGVRSASAAHLGSPFEVHVFIAAQGTNPVPSGKWYPELDSGTGLIGMVGRNLVLKAVAPTKIFVNGPTVVRPHLIASIYALPNILKDDVKYEVERNLKTYFLSVMEAFGKGVPLSNVIGVIENTRGVDWVNVAAFHRQPLPRFIQGYEQAFTDATVTISDFGSAMSNEEYTIRWLNSGIFQLIGEGYGVVTDENGNPISFAVGTDYDVVWYNSYDVATVAAERRQFSLNVTLGAAVPRKDDVWTFSTDNYSGNLDIKEYEMLVPTLLSDGGLDPSEFELSYGGGLG